MVVARSSDDIETVLTVFDSHVGGKWILDTTATCHISTLSEFFFYL